MGSFFFFQAEDGIRDVAVTGVQTCALPISTAIANARSSATGVASGVYTRRKKLPASTARRSIVDLPRDTSWPAPRSEERRVGKSVDLGGRRIIKKKKTNSQKKSQQRKTT